jgi:hypothetical protein
MLIIQENASVKNPYQSSLTTSVFLSFQVGSQDSILFIQRHPGNLFKMGIEG